MNTDCQVYRCARQNEMFLYVRTGLPLDKLPAALLQRTGQISVVMNLQLSPQRKLARVDVVRVIQKLDTDGWFLQMPPEGHIKAHLHFGD